MRVADPAAEATRGRAVSWGKLCGTFAFHRKVLEVGNEGAGAFARMIAFSCEGLTDGKLTRAAASAIASPELLGRLVDVGLLEVDGDGFAIHDFGDFNPTGQEVKARRADLSAKRSAAGRQGMASRWAGHNKTDNNRDNNRDNNGGSNPITPSPSPSPSPIPSTGEEIAPSAPLVLSAEPPSASKASSKSKKPAKHSPEQILAKERVVQAFVEAFTAAKGVAPTLDNAGDHAAAFALALKFGCEEASAIVRRAAASTREGWSPTLRIIAGNPDAWRGTAPRRGPGGQPVDLDAPWLRPEGT
jgi:hypothetical protein